MEPDKAYFFCGIGGSGMLPLALFLKAKGAQISGSDRALDQGRTTQKFDFLRARGIALFRQDGSGITRADLIVVSSAAVEETVADVQAARRLGARMMTRAELLAELFNAAPLGIGIAGTSGKSTITGMTGWILSASGQDPTIMNGAVMTNFLAPDLPFSSAVVGSGKPFVSEVDESDGSIALYEPHIAVVSNVAVDHKPLEELRTLFADFAAKAKIAVLNIDNGETAALAAMMPNKAITYGIAHSRVQLHGTELVPSPGGITFEVREGTSRVPVRLRVPGRHNVANALAALGAARAAGVPLDEAAAALASFAGIRRRLEVAGTANGITVIDDFAHNPDKIAATLSTLHEFPGRLLVFFQPHGFGPLKLMRDAFVEVFTHRLNEQDMLIMSDPIYFGGSTDRSVTSGDIVRRIQTAGRTAFACGDRMTCRAKIMELASPGDRIVVMGARDDTLSQFAAELLGGLPHSAEGLTTGRTL